MVRMRLPVLVTVGLLVALLLAFFVGPRASGEPDGLERVALDQGFAERETTHALDGAPTAGYAVQGVDDEGLSTGIAGLIGVTATFVAGGLLFRLMARTRRRSASPLVRSP